MKGIEETMKKGLQRGLSLFVVMMLYMSLIPAGVIAEEISTETESVVNDKVSNADSPQDINVAEQQMIEDLKLEMSQNPVTTDALQTTATESGFEYVDINGGVSITKYTGTGGDVAIPSTLGGKKVLRIGDNAFLGCASIESISLPEGVSSIGYGAFASCTSIVSIGLSNGVTSIGDHAFENCSSLTSISLPEGILSIGYAVFSKCISLTSVTIPESVTGIGDYAFWNCSSLTSISMSEGITNIGYAAFYGCKSLKGFSFPASLIEIGDYAFWGCSSITNISLSEGVINIGYAAFYGSTSLMSLIIPKGVINIGDWAFGACTGLTDVSLEEGVANIGAWAFSKCTGLTSVSLPESLKSIGISAFGRCSGLTSISIPEGVTSIGDYAFKNCDNLTKVFMHDNVMSIGLEAFKESPLVTIYGIAGSYAESYANKNSISFIRSTLLRIESFSADKASGQFVGTDIKLAATGTGGTLPYQYKFYYSLGTETATIQDFSANSMITFKPTTAGIYTLYVGVRDANDNVVTKIISEYVIITNILLGDVDVNGKVQAFDALVALQIATGKKIGTPKEIQEADVGKSGKVEAFDALRILQYATGKITKF